MMAGMKIASWNINSLPVRMPRILQFLGEVGPDVLCLQETKVRTEAFPHLELQLAGYQAVEHSSGGRNGVAMLIRDGLTITDVVTGLPDQPNPDEARWIQATVEGVGVASVYVPNGRSLSDPAFVDKLSFLRRLVDQARNWTDVPAVIAGDLNIAPADADVHDPARYVNSTHTSPVERQTVTELTQMGYVDVYRHLNPDDQQFTWWDYRAGNFHKNIGMRIDLFLGSQPLWSTHTLDYLMARDYRKGTKPSDHAPIVLTIADGRIGRPGRPAPKRSMDLR